MTLEGFFRAFRESLVHPVAGRGLLSAEETDALHLEFDADERVEVDALGDDVAAESGRWQTHDAELLTEALILLVLEEGDLALVVFLPAEETIPHEAFAGQVLANLNALESKEFCEQKAGGQGVVGRLPMDKINLWGGSLSIGHPFAATGVRLVGTAASRLHHENQELAVVSACAAGGLGTAMLIKRF